MKFAVFNVTDQNSLNVEGVAFGGQSIDDLPGQVAVDAESSLQFRQLVVHRFHPGLPFGLGTVMEGGQPRNEP